MPPFYFILVVFLVDFRVSTCYVEDIRKEGVNQKLVYYGKPFRITEAPYMAIYFMPIIGALCGASIVHERHLVFAAHCVEDAAWVKVGTDTVEGGERYDIERQIIHPGYDPKSVDCDIAIIKLRKKLLFSDRVQPIKLAPTDIVLNTGDIMLTMGFGMMENGKKSRRLLKIDVPYLSPRDCAKNTLYFNLGIAELTKNMMCTESNGLQKAWTGDSGGPLVYKGVLAGVVSFTFKSNSYTCVYARISALRGFITAVLQDSGHKSTKKRYSTVK